MRLTPPPAATPPGGSADLPPAPQSRKAAAPVYGRHGPGRDIGDALQKMTGAAPSLRTLAQVDVTPPRLAELDARLAGTDLPGRDGEDAETLVTARAVRMRAELKATANSFGANANLRAYGGAGLATNVFKQAADSLDLPAESTKPLKTLPYAASLVHGSSAVAAAPGPTQSQLVPGANAKPVGPSDVARSFDPFGMRLVKDKALSRLAVAVAMESGVVPGPAAQLAGSVLGFLSGQRAAAKTAEIVFARRAENDWSVQTPLLNSTEVVGVATAHAVPETHENGRVELGRVELFRDDARMTLSIGRPANDTAPVTADTEEGIAAPKRKTARDRTRDFVTSLPKTLPTRGTATKLGAQISGVFAAAAVGGQAAKGLRAALGTGTPPHPIAAGISRILPGVAGDAAFSSVFLPGFQAHGEPAATTTEAARQVALASTPGANLLGSGPAGRADNVVFDDVTFAPAAGNEVEMYLVLAGEFPGSVALDPGTGTLGITDTEALWTAVLEAGADLN